jgi:hypothetical protein
VSAGEFGWQATKDGRVRITWLVPPGGSWMLPAMNLQQLRRLDDDAEAAIRRISIVKLTAPILAVFAVALAAQLVLALISG